jgi:hypothetical protein
VINVKNHLYCILSERILLFSINSFTNELIIEILDYLYEWNLLENGKIKKNTKYINDILKNTINSVNSELIQFAKEKSMKLKFFQMDINFSNFSDHLEEPEKFTTKVYNFCKKIFTNNKKLPILDIKFCENSIIFDDMPCLGLTGEQKEKLLKILNTRKN